MGSGPLNQRRFTAGQAALAANLAYHQVNHWCKTGLLEPSVRTATGSDSLRIYSFADVVALRVVGELRSAGLACESLAKVAQYLQRRAYERSTTGLLLGYADGGVEEIESKQLASRLRDRQVTFAWMMNLGKVIRDAIKAASGIERATRGRASQVA